MHCSGYKTHENMTAYFGRMYQARYLTGMVAGSMTRKNEIGYVAAFPIPEVIRGINAFTLGARAVNPDARVRVVWTRTWYSPDDEKKAAESLLDVGVDVIAQHQDSAGPQEAAEARGVYSVGYNTDMSAVAPGAHLTSAVWRWEDFYKNFIAKVQAGEWKNGNFWYGLDSGLVGIAPYGAMVPQEVRDRVDAARQDIIDGSLVVFAGPVRDRTGGRALPKARCLKIPPCLAWTGLSKACSAPQNNTCGELPAFFRREFFPPRACQNDSSIKAARGIW